MKVEIDRELLTRVCMLCDAIQSADEPMRFDILQAAEEISKEADRIAEAHPVKRAGPLDN